MSDNTSDILKHLRNPSHARPKADGTYKSVATLCFEAADEIERLLIHIGRQEVENARLRDENARLEKEAAGRRSWLYRAKQERGYSDNVSFDTVWAETCALADKTLGKSNQ